MKINKFLSLVAAGMLALTTAATGAISLPGGVAFAVDPSYTSWKIKTGSTVVAQAGTSATAVDYSGTPVPATGKLVYIEPGASVTLTAETTGSGNAGYMTSYAWTLSSATNAWIQEAVDNVTATGTSITVNTRASFTGNETVTLNITEKKTGEADVNYTALSIKLAKAVKQNTDTFIVIDPDAYDKTMTSDTPGAISAADYAEKGDTSFTWYVNGAVNGKLNAGLKAASGSVAISASDKDKDAYIYWTSSNPNVAIVGDNSAPTDGGNTVAVTAKGVGTTTITAKLFKRTSDVEALPAITATPAATATFTLEVKTAVDTIALKNVTDDADIADSDPLALEAGKTVTLKATGTNSANPNPSFFPINTSYTWAFHTQTADGGKYAVVNDEALQYFSVSSLSGETITVTPKGNVADDKYFLVVYPTSSSTYNADKSDDYKGTVKTTAKISASGVQRKIETSESKYTFVKGTTGIITAYVNDNALTRAAFNVDTAAATLSYTEIKSENEDILTVTYPATVLGTATAPIDITVKAVGVGTTNIT